MLRKFSHRPGWPIIIIVGSLGVITYLHYTTAPGLSRMHVVYRYFYFLPIVYAALRYGYRGGLLSALLASLVFAPHIFFKWGSFPEDGLNDLLIIVVFYGVAFLTGITIDRLRQVQASQANTVAELETSLHRLALQGEELRRAQHLSALGMLAGGLAHEIRNPIGIIRACAQLLAMENKLEIAEPTAIIQQETSRVEALIQELLDYAGGQHLTQVPTAITPLLQRISDRIRPLTTAHEIVLSLDVEPDLPPLCLDAVQIERALLNLCMNAIQALDGPGQIHLHAAWVADDVPLLEIRVTDTGPGILPVHQTHIFEPFYSTKGSGTGLGLSVVHRIVTDHGGHIRVESTPPHGTTFIIQLPGSLSSLPLSKT
jgi:two-component system, NtrC family, sensor histidine kinase HydH